jgi:hypothetical protein
LELRQFPLTELYEVSSPLLLSDNELVGQRFAGEKSREGNLSSPANRSSLASSLLLSNESPCALEIPLSGHRDCAAAPLDIDPARDAKSPPEPDAAPARSLQLLPVPLTPQVCELSPLPFDPGNDGSEKPVPIDPVPVPTPAVVVAYSPIVCALACDARNAITEINTAAGNNKFFRLIASPC